MQNELERHAETLLRQSTELCEILKASPYSKPIGQPIRDWLEGLYQHLSNVCKNVDTVKWERAKIKDGRTGDDIMDQIDKLKKKISEKDV